MWPSTSTRPWTSRLDPRTQLGIEFRELLNHDLQTATAWALKENFHHFWSYQSWTHACRFLDIWEEAAHETDLKPVQRVAAMIEKHAEGLLHFIHHPITNAASEGINSTIHSLKHAARGLVNFKSLRIRILFFPGKLNLRPTYELPTNSRKDEISKGDHHGCVTSGYDAAMSLP